MMPESSFGSQQVDRGVAPIIATVLLLAIAFSGLALYQLNDVPRQNAETEFEHFEDVQNDMRGVHEGVHRASRDEVTEIRTVTLGTNYRPRIVAINPPAVRGSIATTDVHNVTVTGENGEDRTEEFSPPGQDGIPTRFIEYEPGYNELSSGSLWYEQELLYHDARDRSSGEQDGDVAMLEQQPVVRTDGNTDTVVITTVQNEFRQSGTGTVTVELTGRQKYSGSIDETVTVSLPTRLEERHWREVLEPALESEEWEIEEDGTVNSDVNVLNLTLDDSKHLEIGVVGVDGYAVDDWVGIEDEDEREYHEDVPDVIRDDPDLIACSEEDCSGGTYEEPDLTDYDESKLYIYGDVDSDDPISVDSREVYIHNDVQVKTGGTATIDAQKTLTVRSGATLEASEDTDLETSAQELILEPGSTVRSSQSITMIANQELNATDAVISNEDGDGHDLHLESVHEIILDDSEVRSAGEIYVDAHQGISAQRAVFDNSAGTEEPITLVTGTGSSEVDITDTSFHTSAMDGDLTGDSGGFWVSGSSFTTSTGPTTFYIVSGSIQDDLSGDLIETGCIVEQQGNNEYGDC